MLLVENISFSYGGNWELKNISFSLEKGAHLSVMGASGCGKSTLLKAIYGLLELEKGEMIFDNQRVLLPSEQLIAGDKRMKYLAQDFGLMPYISVAENIGKYLSNLDRKKKQNRVQELLQLIDLQEFESTKPNILSGGQQQRVALAMCLAKEPELLLLDEPFSHIDHFRRHTLRRNLFQYAKEKGITCIVATHDSADALAYSNKILVLANGEKIAFDTPENLYKNPENFYTASLFGEVNRFFWQGKEQILYPHDLVISTLSTDVAVVKEAYFQGDSYLLLCEYEGQEFQIRHQEKISVGTKIAFQKK